MKVLLLKDAKEDDSGQDPYIRVSARDSWSRKAQHCLTSEVGVGRGDAKTEELAQNKLFI